MKIIECKTNHLENPLGYRMEKPVFSYQITDADGKRQTEARIRVSTNADLRAPFFDTGFTPDIDSIAYQADIVLAPRTRYYWDVTARSDSGEEAASDVNWFETGKHGEEWCAKWITCDSNEGRHPIFFKDIITGKAVKSARLYICGLGLYEAYLNGNKISNEFLTPYCNNYNRWLQYQTYDITDMLADGGELEVILGNGWYKGRFGVHRRSEPKGYYGSAWKLIAELRIAFADGSEAVIGTDESWLRSPIKR